jgi:hypothetical protein
VGVLSPIYQKMLVDKKINSAFRPEAPSMWMTLERQGKRRSRMRSSAHSACRLT